jgi:hypothetical protein
VIRVLLPVNLYKVKYQLAHGRPYSRFEELLLRAISEDAGEGRTFDQLRHEFQVHVRLLTEGLVTLIQEGWVAMAQNEHQMNYLLTEDGRQTIQSGRRPSNMRVRPMTATIAQERLGGGLARFSDLALLSANSLRNGANRKARRMALTPRLNRRQINGGEAERWLPRSSEQQEWIRWIDSASHASQDLHFLPVQVELEKEEVTGLPHHWRHLSPVILEEVRERGEGALDESFEAEVLEALRRSEYAGRSRSHRGAVNREEPEAHPYARATITCADVALTGAEGHGLLQKALEAASRHVLMVFGELDGKRADHARQAITELRKRGIQVDVLWSCDEGPQTTKEILRELGKARAVASPSPGTAVTPGVTFNREPSSHAVDLVLSDTEDGPMAVLGTAPWETSADRRSLSPALRLIQPTVIATLARLCAGWMDELPGNEGALPSQRWRRIAEQWAARTAYPTGSEPTASCVHLPAQTCVSEVTLLLGPERVALREKLLATSGPRLMVADGRTPVEDLHDRYVAELDSAQGVRYFSVGGSDGWIFERRTANAWSPVKTGDSPSASERHRIFADRDHWLIEYADSPHAALSFLISEHAAAGAWARTSVQTRSPDGSPSSVTYSRARTSG